MYFVANGMTKVAKKLQIERENATTVLASSSQESVHKTKVVSEILLLDGPTTLYSK